MRLGAEVAGCPTEQPRIVVPPCVCAVSLQKEGGTCVNFTSPFLKGGTTFQEGRGKDSNSSSKVGTSPPALELGARPSGTSLRLATFGPHCSQHTSRPKSKEELGEGEEESLLKGLPQKG